MFNAAQTGPQPAAGAEIRLLHGDGSWRQVELTCTDQRATPEIGGLVLNVRDVTQRRALEEELAHRAYHDAHRITHRALLVDRLDHALARAARLGGDEFIVLLEDLSTPDDALLVANRFLERLRAPIPLSTREVTIGASIGVAISSEGEAMLPDDLLRQADVAMYAAKSHGKSRIVAFDPSMHERSLERLEMETDLRRALERDELLVYYGTVVDLASERISGVEALVRWRHPARGVVMPDEFVPMAEETGLIVPLGRGARAAR